MSSLDLVGVELADAFALRWTFEVVLDGETFQVYARTLGGSHLVDLQTSDGHAGSTGSDDLDQAVAERIRKIVALHSAFRALDAAQASSRSADRFGGLRRAA